MSVETWNERGSAGVAAPAGAARFGRMRTRLGLGDAALQLWRAKWLMLLVFLSVALLGASASLIFPTRYASSARLLVTPGQDDGFDPAVREAGRSAFSQRDEALQAETELAASPLIAERVIKQIGLSRLYPTIADAEARAPEKANALEGQALDAFASDFSATSAPKSSILKLTFAHPDPQLAAETLNAFVNDYFDYRREVLDKRTVSGLSEQRAAIDGRLKAADEALQAFLTQNNVSDFGAEKDAVMRQFGVLTDELSAVDASRRETEGRIDSLRNQLATTPRQSDLFLDTTSGQELFNLKLEREKLLVRYKPESQAVQDVERMIQRLESFIADSPQEGLKRIGPNPTWQALETDLAAAKANAEALKSKGAELLRQRAEVEIRRTGLFAVEPEFRRLSREREALAIAAQSSAVREQTQRSRTELTGRNSNNVSIYEPARAPEEGSSPKRLIAIAGAGFGLVTALMVGLLSALSLHTLPTARSVERTLGLKVLGATGVRPR